MADNKMLLTVQIVDNFVKAAGNIDFWRKAMADAQKDSKTTKKDFQEISTELAKASNKYQEAKKAIEGVAKSEELLNEAGKKTSQNLGEMQKTLAALSNTPFDILSEADEGIVKQHMANITASINDLEAEIKGLDPGEWATNLSDGFQAVASGVDVLGKTFGVLGVESEVFNKLQQGASELSGVMQALGVVSDYLGASKWKLVAASIANVVSNTQEWAVKKQNYLQTVQNTIAEGAYAGGKLKGIVVTKLAAVAQWALNAATYAYPIMWVVAGILAAVAAFSVLNKAFGSSAKATKEAEKAQAEYDKQVKLTQNTIDEIDRKSADQSKKKELQGRQEVLDMKKNGASKEEIAAKEAQNAQELRDIAIQASLDKEKAKKDELGSLQNSINKEDALLTNLGKKHGEGSKQYKEQYDKVQELIKSKNELIGVIKTEQNTQADLNLTSAEASQQQKDADDAAAKEKTQKYKEAHMKNLETSQRFGEAQLKLEQKYRNDSTKTDAENAALKFQHEQDFELRSFNLQQESALKKLNAQLKYGDITQEQYAKEVELLGMAQKDFANTQDEGVTNFLENRRKEIIGLIEKDAISKINDVKANYAQAIKDIDNDPKLSKDDKDLYKAGLKRQQAKEEEEIHKNSLATRLANIDSANAAELIMAGDNAREKLRIEQEIATERIEATRESLAEQLKLHSEDAEARKRIEQELATAEAGYEMENRARNAEVRQLDLNKALLDEELNAKERYELKKEDLRKQLEAAKGNADAEAKIKADMLELDKEHTASKIEKFQEWADMSMEMLGALNEFANAIAEAELQKAEEDNERKKASLAERLKAGTISQEEHDKEVAKLDADLDKKKAEIAKKQAIREKAMAVTQAIISTSLAVLSALNTQPFLPLGPIMAGVAGAMGAIQIATILATPLPKARRGGYISGASHANGGVLIEAEGGENVINRHASRAFPELIGLMNAVGNTGGRMPDGGYASRSVMRETPALDTRYRLAETTVIQGRTNGNQISLFNADELAQKLGEKIGQQKIYVAVEDIRRGDKMYADIDQLARM